MKVVYEDGQEFCIPDTEIETEFGHVARQSLKGIIEENLVECGLVTQLDRVSDF